MKRVEKNNGAKQSDSLSRLVAFDPVGVPSCMICH